MLPFVRKQGYPAPDFDFQVPGVTSNSADLHITLNYAHAEVIDEFLGDLANAVKRTRKPSWHKLRDSVLLRSARPGMLAAGRRGQKIDG